MATQRGSVQLAAGDALLIVDVQNDFLPGGALAVPDGDKVIPLLNQYIRAFQTKELPVIASRDWHPAEHCSFQGQGGPWPPHCIGGTVGAELAADLQLPPSALLVSKATQQERDSYSAFDATPLADLLRQPAASRLFVGGLATEYCVLHSVQDAIKAGFQVVVLADAVRAIDAQPGAGERAIQQMVQQGAKAIGWEDLST